jgi:uncharacterized membrane protein YeaQ/YmgE (transglycosylase-associated protein family)
MDRHRTANALSGTIGWIGGSIFFAQWMESSRAGWFMFCAMVWVGAIISEILHRLGKEKSPDARDGGE